LLAVVSLIGLSQEYGNELIPSLAYLASGLFEAHIVAALHHRAIA
jgi:hypothetical protein